MKKISVMISALVLCLLMLPVRAAAASVAELAELSKKQDIVIVITYDKEEPSFTVTDPKDKTYSKDADYTAVERADYATYLYIKDAAAGKWSIEYDKKGNTELNAAVMPWEHPLVIESLAIGTLEDNKLTAEAEISCDKITGFKYSAYAVTLAPDGSVDGKKEIGKGSGSSGKQLNIKADTAELPDGEYHLQLEVYYTTADGVEMPSWFVTDDTFTVVGNTLMGEDSQLTTVLDLTNGILYLEWEASEEQKVTSWVLGVYAELDMSEPLYASEFDKNETSEKVILDRADGDVRVELFGILKNGGYLSLGRTVRWDAGVTVRFDTPEVTNSVQGAVSYDTAGKTVKTVLSINGSEQELQLTGSGTVSLQLDEMEVNEVSLTYSLEAHTYYTVSQRIAVDSLPPMLDLFGVQDRLVTDTDSITVSGETEAGATLTVNGAEQTLDEAGGFMAELQLQKGENLVVFEAKDSAGNSTPRTLVVFFDPDGSAPSSSGTEKSNVPWVLIFTAGGSLMALLLMALFSRSTASALEKAHLTEGLRTHKLIALLRGLFCSLFISGMGLMTFSIVKYYSLSDSIRGDNLPGTLQQSSTQQVAELIKGAKAYQTRGIIFGVGGGIALALFAVMMIVGSRLVKKQKQSICQNCGSKLRENAKFCNNCGSKVE